MQRASSAQASAAAVAGVRGGASPLWRRQGAAWRGSGALGAAASARGGKGHGAGGRGRGRGRGNDEGRYVVGALFGDDPFRIPRSAMHEWARRLRAGQGIENGIKQALCREYLLRMRRKHSTLAWDKVRGSSFEINVDDARPILKDQTTTHEVLASKWKKTTGPACNMRSHDEMAT